MAHHGPIALAITDDGLPLTPDAASGRAVLERRAVHLPDIEEVATEYPTTFQLYRRSGHRTILAVPLLSEQQAFGVIVIRRLEPRPFTAAQIAALESFADQAAIAIAHARLFHEVTEALERERATGAILRVIASSPTTVDPVFDAILDSALRLCASPVGNLFLVDGEAFRLVAHRGLPTALVESWQQPQRHGPHTARARATAERRPIQIVDLAADRAYDEHDPHRIQAVELMGASTALCVPMLKDGMPIGVIDIWRREVRAFSESQIQLLSMFADQAVIAIENVRLFTELGTRNRELTEALEQQTATSEILRVISSSPTDVQPVFDIIVQSAMRLCDGRYSGVYRFDGEIIHLVAQNHDRPEVVAAWAERYPCPPDRGSAVGRTILDRSIQPMDDAQNDPRQSEDSRALSRKLGYRSYLVVPMLREGRPIGAIRVARAEARAFTDKQTALLRTFADQAVIAIENVRLFTELRRRTVPGRGSCARHRGAGAADGDRGDSAGHLQLPNRHPAGLRGDRPKRGDTVRCVRRLGRPGGRGWDTRS